jgi:hypothetical protein
MAVSAPAALKSHASVIPVAGDGAGMLCAMPDSFLSSVLMDEQSFKLPPLGDYAVGMVRLGYAVGMTGLGYGGPRAWGAFGGGGDWVSCPLLSSCLS